jgi:DNA processing protein
VEGGGVTAPAACDRCLRRGALLARLAPRIAGLLDRPRERAPALLSLSDADLIEALAGNCRADVESAYQSFSPSAARDLLARTRSDAVCRHADSYPERLRDLKDKPNPVYLRGGLERLRRLSAEPAVAIVGGRQASEYAREVAREMGRGLVTAGVTVVSGLALGVDAASHRGALAGGDTAIAVLACGPDYVYPRRHARLYEQIVERGVVLSELPPGTPPFQWSFPARNRIMAALGQLVVVVEARESSGSLITAEFASDLGRDVAAVPGQVTARAAAGSNRLLHDGAAVVRDAEDILDELFGVSDRPRVPAPRPPLLDQALRIVLDAIEVRDSLQIASRRAGLSAGGLRAALGRLEALGLVRSDGLGGYERCVTAGRAS